MPDIQNIPTTQYVGPRIIPHLWDPILWDASTQYDALAVVQYNGVPYIARYVPPQGTLPTNTEYWVRWADFNAQMAQLQQIVESFDNRISANATDIDTLEAIVPRSAFSATNTVQKAINDEVTARTAADTALDGRVATNESDIDTLEAIMPRSAFTSTNTVQKAINDTRTNLQSQITTIGNTIDTLATYRDHVIVLGDSLSRYSYDGQVIHSGDELWTKVSAMTGYTVHNFAVGGAGFINTGYTANTMSVQANQAIDDATIDESKVRCIVVMAGTNDYSLAQDHLSTMQSAVRTVWNVLGASRFSGIPIYFVFDQAGYNSHYTLISNLIYGLSESSYRAPVKGFNANSWLRWYDNIGNDGVHPNNYGYNTLAYKLAQIVATGDVHILDVPIHTAPNPYNAEILGNKVVYDGDRLYIRQFYAIPAGNYEANSAGAVMLNLPRFANVLADDYMSNYYAPITFPSAAIANLVTDPYKFMGIMSTKSDGSVDVKLSHPAFTSPSYQTRIMMIFDIPC